VRLGLELDEGFLGVFRVADLEVQVEEVLEGAVGERS
jgi:hypothetical protein